MALISFQSIGRILSMVRHIHIQFFHSIRQLLCIYFIVSTSRCIEIIVLNRVLSQCVGSSKEKTGVITKL